MGLENLKKRSCYEHQINRCAFRNIENNDYDYSLADIVKRSGKIKFDESYLNKDFMPHEKQTPFFNIVISDLSDVIPEKHKDLLFDVPEYELNLDIDWFVLQLKAALKQAIIEMWDSNMPHLVFHSGGYDSRILSAALKELHKEKGDKWLGKVHFRCHQPEIELFNQIMKIEGWDESQYSGWYGSNTDHYNLGIKDIALNGFSPIDQQMNFWQDIVPLNDEKNWVVVSGEGGEMFKYMAKYMQNGEAGTNEHWCDNKKMNLLIAKNPGNGDWEGHWYVRFHDAIMPFFSYIYQREAQKINPSLCTYDESKSCDNIRLKLMNAYGFDFTSIEHGIHQYNWDFSDERRKRIADDFNNSKFYALYKEKLPEINPEKNLYGYDSKVWGFMTLYDNIFNHFVFSAKESPISFSIIITAHEIRGFLDDCIMSCKDAISRCLVDMPNDIFEIILASDGNPELKDYADKHNILFSLSSPKKNLAKSFNSAVLKAKGDYLKIIADDDVLDIEGFYQLCRYAKEKRPDVIMSNYSAFKKDINNPDHVYNTPVAEFKNDLTKLICENKIGGGTALVNRKSFLAVGGMDDNFNIAEGRILWLRLLNGGFNNFYFLDLVTIHYRLHDNQKSRNISAEKSKLRKQEMADIQNKYDIGNTRINQCYCSVQVGSFKDNLFATWKLQDYHSPDMPALFYGMYGENELSILKAHKSTAVVIWTGSDACRPENIKQTNLPNVIHIASNKFIEDDLKNSGIQNYKFIPVAVVDHEKLNIQALPLGDKIYVYLPYDEPKDYFSYTDFYGNNLIKQLVDWFGADRFIFAKYNTYTQEQLYNEIYPKCFVGLRLYKHDGLSETVVEMGLFGRKMIYNGIEPNAIPFNNFQDIVKAIIIEEQNIGKTFNKLSQSMRQYINCGDNWLFTEKQKATIKTICSKNKKIIAAIPVSGRRPLLPHTIKRLYEKCGVSYIICIGDNSEDKAVCCKLGVEWVEFPNNTLGSKWNAGLKAAEKYDFDAFLFVGSSDFVSDNWLEYMSPLMDEYDMVGKVSCKFLDLAENGTKIKMCDWKGYTVESGRYLESIGAGRLYSRSILEKLNFELFDNNALSGMDNYSMKRVINAGGKIKAINDDEIQALSISTDQWENKHKYAHVLDNENQLPLEKTMEFINKWFPEALKIF